MPNDFKKLQRMIHALEEENQSLKATLKSFQQSQDSYEKIIGDSNANQLSAEMALMELEQIFSAYTDGMWVVREDGLVVRVNQPMLDLLGKKKRRSHWPQLLRSSKVRTLFSRWLPPPQY